MFTALNQQQQMVWAEEADENKRFYCPSCQEPVFLKKGELNQAHFAHYQQSKCQVFSEGETEEHLLGKKILYEWFKKQQISCQLEAFLPELNQRPDLSIRTKENKLIAVEFQCSPLPVKRMIERTSGYQEKGYEVFWIVGKRFRLQKKITSFQRLFLKEGKNDIRNLFFQLDADTAKLIVFTNIQIEQLPASIASHRFDFHLLDSGITLEKIKSTLLCKETNRDTSFSLLKSHDFLNTGRLFQNPKMVDFQKYIYYRGYSLISLPVEVYLPIKNDLYIQTIPHYWKFIFLNWVLDQGIGNVVDRNQMEQKFIQMIKEKQLTFYPLPCLTRRTKLQSWKQVVSNLVEKQVLLPVSPTEWLIKQKPFCFSTESEKLMTLMEEDRLQSQKRKVLKESVK